jgi:hypothetical protein
MYDPISFVSQVPRRVGTYFVQTLRQLLGWPIGVLAALGMLLSLVQRPTREQTGYYVFGILFFGLLSLVFYNNRFLLFVIAAIMVLSVQAVFRITHLARAKRPMQAVSIAMIGALILYSAYNSIVYNRTEVSGGDITFRRMGERFQRQFPAERGRRVVARKPFFAYFAGLEHVHMPVVRSVDDLLRYIRENEVDYLLFSFIAARTRPMVAELVNPTIEHQGLKVVAFHRKVGVLYRVEPVSADP